MTALGALKAAGAAGITIRIAGDDLLLQAATRPPDTVLDLLSQHKTEVMAILAATEYERNERELLASRTPLKKIIQPVQGEPGLDQSCAARRGRVEELGGVLLHFCVECGRFGPFGYDVRLRAGQLGRWYCRDHRPQESDEAGA